MSLADHKLLNTLVARLATQLLFCYTMATQQRGACTVSAKQLPQIEALHVRIHGVCRGMQRAAARRKTKHQAIGTGFEEDRRQDCEMGPLCSSTGYTSTLSQERVGLTTVFCTIVILRSCR